MSGPCLCGDPYCGSCGDPAAAHFSDFIDSLAEELEGRTESECRLFLLGGRSALANVNEAHFFPPEKIEGDAEIIDGLKTALEAHRVKG